MSWCVWELCMSFWQRSETNYFSYPTVTGLLKVGCWGSIIADSFTTGVLITNFFFSKETERLRRKAVIFLRSALCKEEKSEGIISLCEGLEGEIFNKSQKLVNNSYRKLSRKVIFGLQSQVRRSELVTGEVTIQQFVLRYLWYRVSLTAVLTEQVSGCRHCQDHGTHVTHWDNNVHPLLATRLYLRWKTSSLIR